jgi:hypothetical protein
VIDVIFLIGVEEQRLVHIGMCDWRSDAANEVAAIRNHDVRNGVALRRTHMSSSACGTLHIPHAQQWRVEQAA